MHHLCTSDIIIDTDGKLFNNTDYEYVQKLSQIIDDSGAEGNFQLGNLFINILRLETYNKDLIKLWKSI